MPATIRPIIVSSQFDRLLAFYTGLFGATEIMRYPEEGPAFYVGLQIGNSELGLVSEESVEPGEGRRFALGIEVDDVDALLPRVEELGGQAPHPANDMPWRERVAHVKDPDGNTVNLTQPL